MKNGVKIHWVIAMAVTTIITSYTISQVSKQNRAWLQIAAKIQKQMEERKEVHDRQNALLARLYSFESATRLIYWGNVLHLNVQRTINKKPVLVNNTDNNRDHKKKKRLTIYSIGGHW